MEAPLHCVAGRREPPGDDRRISTVDEVVAVAETVGSPLRVLLLADDAHPADVVTDHIEAIKCHSRHAVTVVNPIRNRRGWTMEALQFDVIVIHYSICIVSDYHLPPRIAAVIKNFAGPKIQIIQDEMRWIDRMTLRMAELGIGAVFSSLEPDNIRRVYHHEHVADTRFISSLPGYVPERLHRIATTPLSARPFDIVYRGRPLPIWLGRSSQEKETIGVQVLEIAETFGLQVDCRMREEDRVYGQSWLDLLNSGRAAAAAEGGATVFDFDESVEMRVKAFFRLNPGATDAEAWDAVVKPHDGQIVHRTITPRVLEAIMCRTPLIMYPGQYRNILEPWEHYIPLSRDNSNAADVVAWLRDAERLQALAERAYRRVSEDPRLQFAHYVSAIDCAIDELTQKVRPAGRERMRATVKSAVSSCYLPLVGAAERRVSTIEKQYTYYEGVWFWMRGAYRRLTQFVAPASVSDPPWGASKSIRPVQDRENRGNRSRQPVDTPARNVLVLCDFAFRHIGTVHDHLAAFKKYSANEVCIADTRTASRLSLDLKLFDVVVLHYSLIISLESSLPKALAGAIRDFDGYKVLFIQDEYRWVDRTAAAISDLGLHLIYSVANEEAIDSIYHHPSISHVRRRPTLTGFVPEELALLEVSGYRARPIDVGYRGRRVPVWLGRFAQEKWQIGQRFREDAREYGLLCDIEYDENSRLYADQWVDFVSNCKAMLGTESGASFIDYAGDIQRAVEDFEAANPGADFETIHDRFLKGRDSDTVIRVISPRCFEAAALRTLMILYPGLYSGILKPWRHYVPLERDHSNMDEVVAVLHDSTHAEEIIDTAYREVALNPRYSYKAMIEEFDDDILKHARPADTVAQPVYTVQALERRIERKYHQRVRIRHMARFILHITVAKNTIYRYVPWMIATFVPERMRPRVKSALIAAGRRIRLL